MYKACSKIKSLGIDQFVEKYSITDFLLSTNFQKHDYSTHLIEHYHKTAFFEIFIAVYTIPLEGPLVVFCLKSLGHTIKIQTLSFLLCRPRSTMPYIVYFWCVQFGLYFTALFCFNMHTQPL